jgi:hypothetical protein
MDPGDSLGNWGIPSSQPSNAVRGLIPFEPPLFFAMLAQEQRLAGEVTQGIAELPHSPAYQTNPNDTGSEQDPR